MSSHEKRRELIIGVDVGGTKTAVLVADSLQHALGEVTLPTLVGHPEGTLQGIANAILAGIAHAGAEAEQVAAIGLGIPGRVDPATGVVREAVHLGWREMPVGSRLSAQLGAPCVLENDVRTATVGIYRSLGSAAPANLAYISIGTGIAAGLVLDGRLYSGGHYLAGEIGHMVIEPGGRRCACGAKGCLETLAAGPAIARLGDAAAEEVPDSILGEKRPVTSEAVYTAAASGDPAALSVVRRVSDYLALVLQQVIMAYDVECIYLGGGVARNGRRFLEPVLQALGRLREGSVLNGEMLDVEKIRLLPPGYNAGTRGAVALAADSLARAGRQPNDK